MRVKDLGAKGARELGAGETKGIPGRGHRCWGGWAEAEVMLLGFLGWSPSSVSVGYRGYKGA